MMTTTPPMGAAKVHETPTADAAVKMSICKDSFCDGWMDVLKDGWMDVLKDGWMY